MRTNCENVGTVSLFYPTAQRSPHRAQKFLSVGIRNNTNAKDAAPAKRADKNAREHTAWLKGLLRIRRKTPSKKLRTHSQKAEIRFRVRFGEAYSALRGWRPIPAALLSHSVLLCSGTEDIPSNYNYRAN